MEDHARGIDGVIKNGIAGEVYNIGGSRHSNCSMLEAIEIAESIIGKKLKYSYTERNRSGDHIWYVSDVSKFQSHYPQWQYKYNLNNIIEEICTGQENRLKKQEAA